MTGERALVGDGLEVRPRSSPVSMPPLRHSCLRRNDESNRATQLTEPLDFTLTPALQGEKTLQTGKCSSFLPKNVSFLTFSLIFCFSGYPDPIKSSLP